MLRSNETITMEVVKKKIDAAEAVLTRCFDLLLDMKHGRNVDVALTTFQPLLAECLYELMQFYQKLQQEKRNQIALKAEYNPERFREIMKDNADYSRVVSDAIKIGKSLGDAFAWMFYCNNRDELDKHFEHDSTGLFVAGIGGRGELEFIKNNSNIDGLYVIYHGMTDMLRVGDFSLYANGIGIVGIGELKTKEEGEKLVVTANITSKVRFEVSAFAEANQSIPAEKIKELQKDFPNLSKQMETQMNLLEAEESEHSSNHYVTYEHALLDSLSADFPVAINQDNSVLLIATWSRQLSLFDVLYVKETVELPSGLTETVQKIMKTDSPHNEAVISYIDTQMNHLRFPIFWWNIGDNICKDIYFKQVVIATVFNPAKLLRHFVDAGFRVNSMGRLNEVALEKQLDGRKMHFEHFESICDLVKHSLMKTENVFALVQEIIHAGENDEISVNTRMNMHIHLSNVGMIASDKDDQHKTV